MNAQSSELYEAVGAIHLHSNFSDGSLSISEIAGIAERKSIDYLMFSDHNTLEPKQLGLEGWYGRILVIIGYEINDSNDRNHYLVFRINKELEQGLEVKEYVRQVGKIGGFGIIAHPAEKRNFSDAYPPYPWTAWDVDGFNGIEIWNQLSEWMEGITRKNIFWRILHPLRSIRFPVWETLERWDKLNNFQRIVGIGGIDVHAYHINIFGFIPVEIYPYKVQFKSIRTHLLTRRFLDNSLAFEEAEKEIFDALLKGRCFVSNYSIGDGRGFRFWAEKISQIYPMGSRIQKGDEVVLLVKSPLSGYIRLIKDGRMKKVVKGRELIYRTAETGVYRVEVFRKKRGWIYSNPIVVTDRKLNITFKSK